MAGEGAEIFFLSENDVGGAERREGCHSVGFAASGSRPSSCSCRGRGELSALVGLDVPLTVKGYPAVSSATVVDISVRRMRGALIVLVGWEGR